jgi:MoaA/NifB/PqqE/SkfB family radical SAM enzyme
VISERTKNRIRHGLVWASRGALGTIQAPSSAQIEVTNRCNLFCRTCTRMKLPTLGDMSYEDFVRVITLLGPIRPVWLSGQGEPLIHPDLARMIRACAERGIRETIVHTNGMLLSGKTAEGLAESGLGEMRVSIDAGTAAEMEYMRDGASMEMILRNVRAFVARGSVRTIFYTVLNRHSIETAHLLPGIAASCGVRQIIMVETVPFRDESTEREIYDRREYQFGSLPDEERLEALAKVRSEARLHDISVLIDLKWYRKRCFEPFQKIYIDFEGNVTPCCRIHNEVFVGNILRDGLAGSWYGETMNEWRRDLLRRQSHRRICIERCNLGIGPDRGHEG